MFKKRVTVCFFISHTFYLVCQALRDRGESVRSDQEEQVRRKSLFSPGIMVQQGGQSSVFEKVRPTLGEGSSNHTHN
jgi:hypothetical protein